MLELSGGLIIDGAGNPGYYGAVGVEGERIRIFRGEIRGIVNGKVVVDQGRHTGVLAGRALRRGRPTT